MVMAKFTVDTVNKLFIAKAGVRTFDVRVDLYSDAKEHWIADDTANKFTFPFIDPATGRTTAQGGPDIDPIAGTSIPTYVYLENGWRVRPDEADHTLGVTGGILLVQGGGDPFVDTLGAFTVRINYQQPVQAIVVASGSVTPAAIAAAVWQEVFAVYASKGNGAAATALVEILKRLNLDPAINLVSSPDLITAGPDVEIDVVEDPPGTFTGTRRP